VGSPPLPTSAQPPRFRPSALLFLLLVSAMAMIVGLLLLTAPRARRRDDLMPHARRKVRRS
jgi:hypothetical protein